MWGVFLQLMLINGEAASNMRIWRHAAASFQEGLYSNALETRTLRDERFASWRGMAFWDRLDGK